MSTIEKIELKQEDRDFVKRRPNKEAYVGVVWFRGPRGRKYRPVRTKVHLTADYAANEVWDIRSRTYRNGAFPIRHEVYVIDFLGNVKGTVEA
jgi:hypothetical protein